MPRDNAIKSILRVNCTLLVLVDVNRKLGIEAARFGDNVDFTLSKLDFVPTETPKITELKIISRGLKVHT